jgi:hypothetical protein
MVIIFGKHCLLSPFSIPKSRHSIKLGALNQDTHLSGQGMEKIKRNKRKNNSINMEQDGDLS